ncbi:hypothetical protein WR25_20831 [Diploscapter pachys]|uniref:CMP/dCMP-type deaminase domain-containing protein n=1 Tax=Diploscapter pachys TaxID=2018661 RepID=A0A2A2JPA2_9BILA|nr:hypothetical protein WR25_20831 [Diploscapter pachys]
MSFMEEAFKLAEEALENNEVPVGCVFVHNGKIISSGRNETNLIKDPTAHAEMVAIRKMRREIPDLKQILQESELYVTLEPCIMCAAGLFELGIKKIVYPAKNPRFGGIESVGSAEKYRVENVKTEIIYDSKYNDRSIGLLKDFYDRENPFCPLDKRKIK